MMRLLLIDLGISLIAAVPITLWYLWMASSEVPSPGSGVGHSLGVVGFLLMLATETLYTLRKRTRWVHRGKMSNWLQAHIFTGMIGAFLVLLHTAGKFQGLAGFVAILTLVVVGSGFVGRYLYTAAPRTVEGVEVESQEFVEQFALTEMRLRQLGFHLPREESPALSAAGSLPDLWIVVARPLLVWRYARQLQQPEAEQDTVAAEVQRLLVARYRLQLQILSVAATRRWLAIWHLLHVPLSVALFVLAFVHIAAAMYYSG